MRGEAHVFNKGTTLVSYISFYSQRCSDLIYFPSPAHLHLVLTLPHPFKLLVHSGFNFSSGLARACPCPFHYLSPSFSSRLGSWISFPRSPTPTPPTPLSGYHHAGQRRGLEMGLSDKEVMDKSDGKTEEVRRRDIHFLWGVTWHTELIERL